MSDEAVTAADVARWMLAQIGDTTPLYQDAAAWEIKKRFGGAFVYDNENWQPRHRAGRAGQLPQAVWGRRGVVAQRAVLAKARGVGCAGQAAGLALPRYPGCYPSRSRSCVFLG